MLPCCYNWIAPALIFPIAGQEGLCPIAAYYQDDISQPRRDIGRQVLTFAQPSCLRCRRRFDRLIFFHLLHFVLSHGSYRDCLSWSDGQRHAWNCSDMPGWSACYACRWNAFLDVCGCHNSIDMPPLQATRNGLSRFALDGLRSVSHATPVGDVSVLCKDSLAAVSFASG